MILVSIMKTDKICRITGTKMFANIVSKFLKISAYFRSKNNFYSKFCLNKPEAQTEKLPKQPFQTHKRVCFASAHYESVQEFPI